MASLSKAASAAAAAEQIALEEAARKRAARQAARNDMEPEAVPVVTVRVLPKGADKISMGVHAAGVGEAHYERGETFPVALDIATELEDRGFVEIQAEVAD
jgi:hypothetical protein